MYSSNRALPKLWKDRILNLANPMDLGISDHQIIRKNNFYCLNKMKNRELYQIQISEKCRKQISSSYYKGYFNSIDFDWNSIYIYILPRIVTANANLRVFQYKIRNNVATKCHFWIHRWFLLKTPFKTPCKLFFRNSLYGASENKKLNFNISKAILQKLEILKLI